MRSFNYMFGNIMLFCESNFINLPISIKRNGVHVFTRQLFLIAL